MSMLANCPSELCSICPLHHYFVGKRVTARKASNSADTNAGPLPVTSCMGLPSWLKTVDRNAITVADVTSDVNATLGHLL